MNKIKRKIRYSYREEKEGFLLSNVKCPVCKSNHINWIEVVEHTSWDGKVKLLVECWSGDIDKEKPRHLFLIELNNLPIVEINKIKLKKKYVRIKLSKSFKKVRRARTSSRTIRR